MMLLDLRSQVQKKYYFVKTLNGETFDGYITGRFKNNWFDKIKINWRKRIENVKNRP